jgi:hypothetical protein
MSNSLIENRKDYQRVLSRMYLKLLGVTCMDCLTTHEKETLQDINLNISYLQGVCREELKKERAK